jgi:hypothetical protein
VPADDFIARSSDELSLAKGDRVELIERDDEFGDGWFLGRHMVNGNSGLFPEGKAQIISMELFRLQVQSVRVKRNLTLLQSTLGRPRRVFLLQRPHPSPRWHLRLRLFFRRTQMALQHQPIRSSQRHYLAMADQGHPARQSHPRLSLHRFYL